MNILITCVGNICRSPMAEYFFQDQAQSANKNIQITSAGISAVIGHSADKFAQELMLERNIDISQHRAKQLSTALTRSAQLILTMETWHKDAILEIDAMARGKIFLLGEWTKEEIQDPYQKSRQDFEHCLKQIECSFSHWKNKLKLHQH